MPLPDYYSRVNPDLLALIPPDCKNVFEIGCGAGALCEAYRRVNPGVKWFGVEKDNGAREAAADRNIDIIGRDAEGDIYADSDGEIQPPLWVETAEMYRREIDCLVFGDVLEHLHDPWNVLKRYAGYCRPGAQILASIPNVGHWTIIRDLLAGKWQYQNEGLLDRTHLRFFTLDSIREMFDQARLQAHEIRGRDIYNEGFDDWIANTKITHRKEMRAYQYIVRAFKPGIETRKDSLLNGPAMPRYVEYPTLHIHAVTAEECCARPRIHEPFAAMRTIPGVTCTTEIHDRMPDIYIQQRHRNTLDLQKELIKIGLLLVAEIDDEPSAIGVDPIALRAVHAVQVSTEPLAEIVRRYNPNVMVFKNQIADLPPWEPIDDNSGIRPTIFYGAQNRETDWAPIMPALNRIIRDYPLQFRIIHDRAFFDALETPEQFKMFVPFCPYEQYRKILRSCDIALLPLEDTPFNRCKSDLKFLECAAEGVVPLMSLAACKAIGDGSCNLGMFFNHPPGPITFEYALRQLVTNKHNGRGLLAEKYYGYVHDNRMLGQHFRKRLAWYRELLHSKSDLTRQLLERVPELAQLDTVTTPT